MELELKRINLPNCKLATNAEAMTFDGYGAVFNNVDSYGDMIAEGAFSAYLDDVKTGKQDWPSMLMQHGGWRMNAEDMTPVGIYTDLQEDKFGLKVQGKLADTPKAQEAYSLMKMTPRPAIKGLSIGYYARESEWGGKQDAYDRLIKKIDVLEISIVTFPANKLATIDGVKSVKDLTDKDLERLLRDVMGLSQKEAKTAIAKGFRALRGHDDASSAELKALQQTLEKNIHFLESNR